MSVGVLYHPSFVLTIERSGPFKDFSCVIGPNGSGKSNLFVVSCLLKSCRC